ncbi:hypothetical protein [Synechococcus sp. OH20]|uniref:hypothetical protein n=1 Tax=Synechococcus sp. OH20 TaxID=139337 RepID=UPI0039C69EA8
MASTIVRKRDRLILRSQNDWFSLFILIFVASAFLSFATLQAASVDSLEISCVKRGVRMADCQFTTIPKLRIFPPSNKIYSEITGAEHQTEVEEYVGDEGDKHYTYSYYLILFTSGRILDRVEVDSNNRAQWASEQINQFLGEGQGSLNVVHHDLPSKSMDAFSAAIIFSSISLIPLFMLFLIINYESVDINGQLRKVIVTQINLLSNRKTFVDFEDVKSISLIEKVDSDGDKLYELKLQTRTAGEITLFTSYIEEKAETLGREIATLTMRRIDRKALPELERGAAD